MSNVRANAYNVMIAKKNAYALKTPHDAVIITVILASRFFGKSSISRGHSIEIPIETFFDLVILTFDL